MLFDSDDDESGEHLNVEGCVIYVRGNEKSVHILLNPGQEEGATEYREYAGTNSVSEGLNGIYISYSIDQNGVPFEIDITLPR